LGEGQLALTKFLLLTDKQQDLRDFKSLMEHILARVNWANDFFVFTRTSFDTLDYASGKINHGSKAMMVGVGDAIRNLPHNFQGELPSNIKRAEVFCGGCLVLEGETYEQNKDLGKQIAESGKFNDWQMIVIHDSADYARSSDKFLWATWTRFNPATDIYAKNISLEQHHVRYDAPIVIDARMKPWYPKELFPREDIVQLVDRRWREYFPK
jgi:3-polyprenyl-4-hydroxybenzoate decarboxylase